MSFASKHMERTLAKKAAAAAATDDSDETMEGRTIYEQMLAQLQTHAAELKKIQSTEDKIELKRKYVPDYDAYVDGILAADSAVQDDVLMQLMVWRLDIGQFVQAYEIATHALEHGLVLPERFKRDLATYLAEEFAEAVILADGREDADVPSEVLLRQLLEDLSEKDMPDQVRAKLHKAIGFRLQATGDAEKMLTAIDHFDRALQLNPKVGLKKRKEQLVRELDKKTATE